MHGFPDAAQVILQILSNPAWSGISSICALIGIPLAVLLARQSKAKQPPSSTHFKKMTFTTRNLFNRGSIDQRSKISKPQEPYTSEKKRSVPPDGISYIINDGYHRACLARELVKDVDIMVVVDPKKLAL